MLPIIGVSISYLLIDVALALVALTVGFFSALWYVKFSAESSSGTDDAAKAARKKEEQANQAERANMAALQLRDLAKNVAIDVGTHNTLMASISSELGELDSESEDSGAAVLEAVSKILVANDKLQDRLAEAEQKIQTQAEEIRTQQSEARTDALTNLANRRAFDDAMRQNIAAFKKQKRSFSLLILDVDHFKKFNDTHGHLAGDEVLRRVGQTIAQVVKSSDIACRYGGEEFALVMPSTKIAQAQVAAERVRKAIEATKIEFEGKTLNVTASIGVAEVARGEEAEKLVRRSDDAVYFSKEAGRNCGHWHDGEKCLPLLDASSPKPVPAAPTLASEKAAPSSGTPVALKDLPDQAVFSDELSRRISESHRFGVSLSVMRIRLKDYANLEKEYGNAVGLLLLDSVAQFIRNTLRDMDLLAKLELGEFVVMLPGSSGREAMLVGARVQAAIANCVIPIGDQKMRLEVQQGVTDVEPDDEVQSMMARAKQMMEEQVEEAAPVV